MTKADIITMVRGMNRRESEAIEALALRIFGSREEFFRAKEQVPISLFRPSEQGQRNIFSDGDGMIRVSWHAPYFVVTKFCPKHGDFHKGSILTRDEFDFVVKEYDSLCCPRCTEDALQS